MNYFFLITLIFYFKVACSFFNSTVKKSDEEYAESMYALMNLYYNYTGQKKTFCINPSACKDSAYGALGDPLGWPWQVGFFFQLNLKYMFI